MTNFVHPYARYTNPTRYRLAKISRHFRVAYAPKEFALMSIWTNIFPPLGGIKGGFKHY